MGVVVRRTLSRCDHLVVAAQASGTNRFDRPVAGVEVLEQVAHPHRKVSGDLQVPTNADVVERGLVVGEKRRNRSSPVCYRFHPSGRLGEEVFEADGQPIGEDVEIEAGADGIGGVPVPARPVVGRVEGCG